MSNHLKDVRIHFIGFYNYYQSTQSGIYSLNFSARQNYFYVNNCGAQFYKDLKRKTTTTAAFNAPDISQQYSEIQLFHNT
jgi:hypothetical protein